LEKISVFIANDDVEFCNSLVRQFDHSFRFEAAQVAYDGLSALEYIKLNQPNIIIIDLMLPVYDGLYIISYIRKEIPDYTPFIYVISTLGSDKTNRVIENLDVDYYSVKSISPEAVVNNTLVLIDNLKFSVPRAPAPKVHTAPYTPAADPDHPYLYIEKHIEEYLSKMGVPLYRLSTRCTAKLLQLALEDTTLMHSMLKLYETTGQSLVPSLTSAAIERNIRSTVKYITENPTEYFKQCFPMEVEKVKNNIFINNSVYLIKKSIENFLENKNYLR